MNFRTALLLASLASANAFSTSSSFTRRLPPSAPTTQPHSYRSTTALSMNLFDRFQRVAKSNINNVLKSLEDPEKIMNQAVEDMQVRQCSFMHKILCSQLQYNSHSLFCNSSVIDRLGKSTTIICRDYRNATSSLKAKGTSRCPRR